MTVKPRVRVAAASFQGRSSTLFDAASIGRRLASWNPSMAGPTTAVTGIDLARRRCRDLSRNSAVAKTALRRIKGAIAGGSGWQVFSAAPDKEFQARADALFKRWARRDCDATGQGQSLREIMRTVAGELATGGEAFVEMVYVRRSRSGSVPLKLRTLPAEMCPSNYSETLPGGAKIEAGIEYDARGEVVAYYFHRAHPGDYGFAPMNAAAAGRMYRRVPAAKVLHVLDREGALYNRGLPWLISAAVDLRSLDDIGQAVLEKQRLSASVTGAIQTPSPSGMPLPEADVKVADDNAVDPTDTAASVVEPGTLWSLAPGEEINWLQTQEPSGNYQAFVKHHIAGAAGSLGLPAFLVSGDFSGMTYAATRTLLADYRRTADEWASIIEDRLLRPLYDAWLRDALSLDLLPIPNGYREEPWPWHDFRAKAPAIPIADFQREVDGLKAAVRSGFVSRRQAAAMLGHDAVESDAISAEDASRAESHGLVFDTDPRHVSMQGIVQSTDPAADDDEETEPQTEGVA